MRRTLKLLALVLLLTLAMVIAPVAAAFYGNTPLVAREAGIGIEVVLDGYASVGLLDAGYGKYALVDAGNDPSGKPILAALRAHGATAESVIAIFLTHGHPDHTAACAVFPNATTYALSPELPYLRGEVAYHGPLPRLFGPQMAKCARLKGVEDSESIVAGGVTLTAYALTGHTAGRVAWLANQTLFVGDAAGVKAPDRVVGPPWVFSDDTGEAEASLHALAARLPFVPTLVVPAHTGSVSGITFTQAYGRP